jgi:hypothetical protein
MEAFAAVYDAGDDVGVYTLHRMGISAAGFKRKSINANQRCHSSNDGGFFRLGFWGE